MVEKTHLYNAKTKQSREIHLVDNIWIYTEDNTPVPEAKLKGFHTNGLNVTTDQIQTQCCQTA